MAGKDVLQTKGLFESYALGADHAGEILFNFLGEKGALEDHGYRINRGANMFALANQICLNNREGRAHLSRMKTIALFEITAPEKPDNGIHDRALLLLENQAGAKAFIAITLHDQASGVSPEPGEIYDRIVHGPAWFGGDGIYSIHRGTDSQFADALEHSERLATTMTQKGWLCGVGDVLRGTKVITTGSEWIKNPDFQFITGLMFSRRGPFPHIITGTDAGQTADSIRLMETGSRLAGGIGQIVGSEKGLPDTPSYVKHSLRATYVNLQQQYPDIVLAMNETRAVVQGFGNIGYHTAKMFFESGMNKVYVTDLLLSDDLPRDIDPNQVKKYQEIMKKRLNQLNKMYPGKIVIISPGEEWDIEGASIFAPCSTAEGIISSDKIDRLVRSGTKVILSGANNPLENPEVAEYAHNQGILMPPDPLSNNGSATAAALEARFIAGQYVGKYRDASQFVRDVLIPHIYDNIAEKVAALARISQAGGISLYKAGAVAFTEWWEQQNQANKSAV